MQVETVSGDSQLLGTVRHRGQSLCDPLVDIRLRIDDGYLFALALEKREMPLFVFDALPFQQLFGRIRINRRNRLAEVGEIEKGGMLATEIVDEVGCGEDHAIGFDEHDRL